MLPSTTLGTRRQNGFRSERTCLGYIQVGGNTDKAPRHQPHEIAYDADCQEALVSHIDKLHGDTEAAGWDTGQDSFGTQCRIRKTRFWLTAGSPASDVPFVELESQDRTLIIEMRDEWRDLDRRIEALNAEFKDHARTQEATRLITIPRYGACSTPSR
ncbi:hypothetical protein AB4144_16985 [Rhizobiaceae sp. 2RAB30]